MTPKTASTVQLWPQAKANMLKGGQFMGFNKNLKCKNVTCDRPPLALMLRYQ